jgi:hypothetical protein
MTESARDEALRLAREAGFEIGELTDGDEIDFFGCVTDGVRLIALARQRPGWVWVPKESTEAMIEALEAAYAPAEGTALAAYTAVLAAAPKPGEGT